MKSLCLYFQIHHPFTFQTFRFFDIGGSKSYYDDSRIEKQIREAATNYYLPTNDFLLKLIHQSKGKLKISFSISGTSLDQFLIYEPKVINSFRQLAETGNVEFLGSTSSHSIASLAESNNEFKLQIKQNQERMEYYFGQKPQVFANSDLMYTSQIAKVAIEAGYETIITNGTKKMLQWRSPNYVYSYENHKKINILFRNEGISNQFSFLFNNPGTPKATNPINQFLSALHSIQPEEPILNIYLNYNALGGFELLNKQRLFRTFVSKIIKDHSLVFCLPFELKEHFGSVAEIGTENPNCWVENFHSSYYPGNELQQEALKQLFKLEKWKLYTNNLNLQVDWQYLQTSDHFHLMDENHPDYLNGSNSGIYKSKYDAFINYMNILEDFRQRLIADRSVRRDKKTAHYPTDSHKIVRKHEF